MKIKINKMLVQKIILFISFTVFMLTMYYKIRPIIKDFGTDVFTGKNFVETQKYQDFIFREISCLQNFLSYDFVTGTPNLSIEYIIDAETTNSEKMLLSNISNNKEELKNVMQNFTNNDQYYICKLNNAPETNQYYLEYCRFQTNQNKFKQCDVYIKIGDIDEISELRYAKERYNDFISHIKEIMATCIISLFLFIITLISVTRNIDKEQPNSYLKNFFKNLHIEEIVVIFGIIIIEGIRLIENSTLIYMVNYIKWIYYFIIYIIASNLYFVTIDKIKNRKENTLFITPKIKENIRNIYVPIIIYIFLVCIFINEVRLNFYLAKGGRTQLVLIYTILLLHVIKQKIELIQINEQIKKIAQGEPDIEILTNNKNYEDLAKNINSLQKGMQNAINEKVKSERLKTDLITNVSHDLKTPLTSIINYIYLLDKENIKNENAKKYIEILKDKSNKLKNLTEDLIEASKISSGNETINLEKLNFTEMILQANGEFAEKFEQKQLVTISNIEKEEILVNLDSKKTWRVLENIYNNIYKYSLEGTRVYVELLQKNNKVVFTIKNISKDELNVSPDELIQRFVRGDKARSSAGNGLGLSISKDLVKLQNGKFNIDIQGDLFIVRIEFKSDIK